MKLESQMILIFGATGDLSRRKLVPSLYHLERKNLLTDCTPIICIGRKEMTKEQFVNRLAVDRFLGDAENEPLHRLLKRIEYLRLDTGSEGGERFAAAVTAIRRRHGCSPNFLIYLALPTTAFQQAVEIISTLDTDSGWKRVVFEKPFGEDLQSARQLNSDTRAILREREIFRVDHYLGKELVQNILTVRFANEIFSTSWRARAIDHVQITVSETLGVEKRAGYYDRSGAVRDMIQNHLLQLLSLVAMEPPERDQPESLRNEAALVLRHLRPLKPQDIVLGQYEAGEIHSETVKGYRQEEGIGEDSVTETYAALRVFIDNERWRGVPFYLRTGKRMQDRYADIRVVFRQRHQHVAGSRAKPNMITFRIQPDEGIALAFNVQKPGEEDVTESVVMDFCHHCYFGPNTPEAYESILRNVIEGDHSLFPRWDWIEASWQYVDRLRAIAGPPVSYRAGSDGPAEAERLLAADGRRWLGREGGTKKVTLPDFR